MSLLFVHLKKKQTRESDIESVKLVLTIKMFENRFNFLNELETFSGNLRESFLPWITLKIINFVSKTHTVLLFPFYILTECYFYT